MALTIQDIEALLLEQGHALYGGEPVSQLAHALQCAWAAEQQGGDDALVVACLLHDLGHLLSGQRHDELAHGQDDLHQFRVLPFLRPLLPDSVVEAIALHVDAKRYLCAVEPQYEAGLSEASRLSLALQGGVMTAAQAEAFAARPHAGRAIALRRLDDVAKTPGRATPPLDHFLPRLRALALA